MPYKCIIVEDEPLALERTRAYAERVPWLEVAATFEAGLQAMVWLAHHPVDIIFLDINLGDISGMELLEKLRPRAEVILTTAYDAYALRGYELQVTDYLLKPYTFERFLQAALLAQARLEGNGPTPLPERDLLFVKTEYRLERVAVEDILYIEGMRDYRRIHTATKRIMTLQNFGHFEQALPPNRICRVHKSYMVALAKIDSIERNRVRIGQQLIPVSDSYRAAFLQQIAAGGIR